jgi:hypothetical protein
MANWQTTPQQIAFAVLSTGAARGRSTSFMKTRYEDPTGDGGPVQPSPTIGHRLIVSW